jgi:hypothetical protein
MELSAEWWAGHEAQVQAQWGGPLGDDPDPEPIPGAVLAAIWAAENPQLIDAELLCPEDLLDPGLWWNLDGDFDDGSDPLDPPAAGDGPAGEPPAGGSPPGAGGPPGQGWWRSADRAVADASAAVRRAEVALGRARRLVHTAGLADAADETGHRRASAGRVHGARTAVEALAAATVEQRAWLAGLLSATGGGGLAERPRLALTDALSGTLLALTDAPGLRRAARCARPGCRRRPQACRHDLTGRPPLGPPPPTAGYRPATELDRWLRARDRRCRFPGCRRRVPKAGELDHVLRWPDGPTSAENLAGFCTTHHRGKHQAPGWTHTLDPDGTLTVTTPTGLTTSTDPPPY